MRALSILAASALALGAAAAAQSADAACKRFGFTVNDYGKEGPTNDAKSLLDKHVVKWAAESGITNYRVGKKDVKCELFLDFVVFDEYTCTASANVCWGGDISKIAPGESDSDNAVADNEKPPAPVSKVAAGLKREKPAVAAAEASAPAETDTAAAAPEAQEAAPAAPVEQAAEQEAAPESMAPPTATAAVTPPDMGDDEKPGISVSSGTPIVETGALGTEKAPEAPASAPGDQTASTGDDNQAAAASSAAAAAAAAAERAAAAAETAAAAAKEAAAAAVAASAANRGVIVPPIDATR